MPIVLVLAILVMAVLVWMLRGPSNSDTPAQIVTAAANRLPVHHLDWGQAMVAELTQVHGRARRWQFAAGVLRVALFPPLRHPHRVLVVCCVGLLAAAGATVAAASEVPSLSVFVGVLSVLLCGYLTVITSRSQRPRRSAPHVIVGVVALAGVAATIIAVVRTAAAHPSATTDPNHLFSIVFAIALTGYLAFALTPPRLGARTNTALWWALAAALGSGAVWTVSALTAPITTDGVAPFLEPVNAAATLTAAIGASVTTRSMAAGTRAGMLALILAAPMHFAIDVTRILHVRHYTLTNPYDIAAYPRSGYPDVASYVLSDDIAGHILAGLVLYPILSSVLALLGAAVGAGLRGLATTPTTDQTL